MNVQSSLTRRLLAYQEPRKLTLARCAHASAKRSAIKLTKSPQSIRAPHSLSLSSSAIDTRGPTSVPLRCRRQRGRTNTRGRAAHSLSVSQPRHPDRRPGSTYRQPRWQQPPMPLVLPAGPGRLVCLSARASTRPIAGVIDSLSLSLAGIGSCQKRRCAQSIATPRCASLSPG